MSFKQFGGLNYAAKNNIIGNLYSNSGNLGITTSLGQDNSKIVCQSHMDISGNSLLQVGNIYFMDGSSLPGSSSETAVFNNGITVYKGANLECPTHVTGHFNLTSTSYAPTASIDSSDNTIATTAFVQNIITTGNLIATDISGGEQWLIPYQSQTSVTTFSKHLYFDASTNILTSSQFSATSDYRIKDNIQLLDESYSIDFLRPVTYINNTCKKQDIGFLAHEIQEYFPYLVTGEKDGKEMQTLNYIGLIGILVKEVQELKKRVVELEVQRKK
uniref:Peptidase S74 domain-containing protein n=1 Tax=viral metagenome TaxID=1070528 RepID=A0A6C0B0D5_9ZZZZ